MRLSQLLLAKKLVTVEGIERAFERQRRHGGRLTDSLLALDLVSIVDLDAVLQGAPTSPMTIAETGLKAEFLAKLLVKAIHVHGIETIAEIAESMMLPTTVVGALLQDGVGRRVLEEVGAASERSGAHNRYRLTQIGKKVAAEAMDQNQYVGPAPVELNDYCRQVTLQAIANEFVAPDNVRAAFADIVIADEFRRRLGPALNSGKSMLLFGPPGNGKTTIAEKIGQIYESVIFIPYALEVGGEIITVFDPSIHRPVEEPESNHRQSDIRREEFDRRWVACKRPFVITGGELTLDMLDLRFNEVARFYEAPLHMKAQGGAFIIDDFGRQMVRPEDLLNRWIIPLERRIDFLKLHTGKQFEIPFDQLTIFSTNMTPDDLMDPAFLRRIPYKIEVEGPSAADFADIFARVCQAKKLPCSDEDVALVMRTLMATEGFKELACYQAKFIVDQVVASCRYEGIAPHFEPRILADAVQNIFARTSAAA